MSWMPTAILISPTSSQANPDGLPLPIAIEKYACMSGPFVNDYTRMYAGYTDAQKEASGHLDRYLR